MRRSASADATGATRIEPRLRERRIAVKRAAGRKRLRWVLVAAGARGARRRRAGRARLVAVRDRRGRGRRRRVHRSSARSQAVVDDLEGTPVLRADTDAAEQQLEAIPWVEDARVTTRLPARGDDRAPRAHAVATFQGADGRFRVIDSRRPGARRVDGQPVELPAADQRPTPPTSSPASSRRRASPPRPASPRR